MNRGRKKAISGIDLDSDINLEQAVDQITMVLSDAGVEFGQGTESAEQEAVWLLLDVCDISDMGEIPWQRKIDVKERDRIIECLVERLQGRRPMAYVLQHTWFAGYRFYVDERVLIPRSFLSEWIPQHFSPWVDANKVETVLDLCCGSGCIGIATALELIHTNVTLSDISPDALAVAQINIDHYQLAHRVDTHCGNRFEGIDRKFDLILCNPPYVSDQRMDTLPEEFRVEPEIGLRAGADGLDFIRPFLSEARNYLNDRGHVIVEAGSAAVAVEAAWPDIPFTWLGTAHDEMAVFTLSAEELDMHQAKLDKL